MGWSEEIRVLLETISKNSVSSVKIFDATVISVDEKTRTCRVNSEKENIDSLEVRLMPEVCDGQLKIPEVDSSVIVVLSTITKPFITNWSWIEKNLIIVGNQGFEINTTGQKFNDGSLGGLAIVPELVKRYNQLENKVNDLISKFNSHTHILTISAAAGTGGAGTAAPTTDIESSLPDVTDRDMIENKSITHGEKVQ